MSKKYADVMERIFNMEKEINPQGGQRMKDDMPENILLPCPFCGGKAFGRRRTVSTGQYFYGGEIVRSGGFECGCKACDFVLVGHEEKKTVVTNWNTRLPSASSECPICGKDTPHKHKTQEIEEWNTRTAQSSTKQREVVEGWICPHCNTAYNPKKIRCECQDSLKGRIK